MCLMVLAYRVHPNYPLIVAANRDEFYKRPTARAHFWEDEPNVLAGRDLEKMGTWMGITRTGRFAAITNVRNPSNEREHARSRGKLVSDFLSGSQPPVAYMKAVRESAGQYNGFNLLAGDRTSLCYFSNQNESIRKLTPGIYGLSNAQLDTPWPKVEKSKQRLKQCLAKDQHVDADRLFQLLADSERAPDSALPDTGVSLDLERLLSSAFIESHDYGTRVSTVLLIDSNGCVSFKERSFYPDREDVSYAFQLTT